jgi:hypothetical protein
MTGDWPEHHCVVEHRADGSWFVWYGRRNGLIVPDRGVALALVPSGWTVEVIEPWSGPNVGFQV